MKAEDSLERQRDILKYYNYTERCLFFIQQLLSPDIIHNENKASGRGDYALLILSFLLLFAQYIVLFLFFAGNYAQAAVIHFASIAVSGLYAWYAVVKDHNGSYAILLAVFVSVTGIFGAAGMIITITLGYFLRKSGTSFIQWYYTLFLDTRKTKSETLGDNFFYNIDLSWCEYDISPFKDVLQYGTDDQKRRALVKMMNKFQPAFGPLMLKALTEDKSNLIRVQAATTINKIKNRFFEIISELKELHKIYPDSPDILISIATAYDDLAYSGILDSDQERDCRKEALAWYTFYEKQKNGNHDISLLIGRIHLRNKEYEMALSYFERAIKNDSNDLRVWLRYAECLFNLKMYDKLQQESIIHYPKLISNPDYSNVALEAIKSWANINNPES